MTDSIKELSTFLRNDSRIDLQVVALHELVALTAHSDGHKAVIQETDILNSLVDALAEPNEFVHKTACLSLVNLSATEEGARNLVNLPKPPTESIIPRLLEHILNPDSSAADAACMTLSNISRPSCLTQKVIDDMTLASVEIDKLVNAFTKVKYNTKGCKLHYLGPIFSNLTQSSDFRRQVLDKDRCIIQKLAPFTEYKDSVVRRGGVVGALRNCCFDSEYHDWLLSQDVDLLPKLLLPLAGSEEFDDNDNDKLPFELQYLGEDKQRETDADIRRMLLESIHQLCAKRSSREYLRQKNAYVILREYHKWEKERDVLLACENIIDVLIRTEEEIGEDNLKELTVPEEYVERFKEMDKQYLNEG